MKRARQFVWLSMDTDNPSNADVVARLGGEGVPMFLVLDPSGGKVALSWYGTATAPQLGALMDDGVRVISGGASGPDAVLARADEANARKDFANAAAFYDQALKLGGEKWPKRPRVIESLIMAQTFARDNKGCAETALRQAPGMARDRSFVNVIYFGLDCAKAGTPDSEQMEKFAEEAVKIPGVFSDDASQLHGLLAYRYREEKKEGDADRVANDWVAYLRRQLAAAKTPEARMALDFQLVSAANVLHKPEIALPEVERAERELPNEYNPPRLAAGLLSQMGRFDDAMNACGRALKRIDGAPKLRLYMTCGGILQRKGDKDAARKMYQEGLDYGQTLPENVAKPALQSLRAAMSKL
ncbi:MAG TPA: hypothetical protein VGF59_21700 [Bryobacteraceae bacterium]